MFVKVFLSFLLFALAKAAVVEKAVESEVLPNNVNYPPNKDVSSVHEDLLTRRPHEVRLPVARIQPGAAEAESDTPISPAVIMRTQNCSGLFETFCYDCRSIVMCAGDEKPIYQGVCPSSAPFCNDYQDARCSAHLESEIEEKLCEEGSQRCTSTGYFPDIYDAQVYHFCEYRDDNEPITYHCPDNYIYDSYSQGCKRVVPFNCKGKDNQFVTYALNGAYYVFCKVDGTIQEMIPYKCRDEFNFIFNVETKVCEYQCKGEGRFVDREDCAYYYECYRAEGGYIAERVKCPGTNLYDKSLGRCAPYYPCVPEVGWWTVKNMLP